MARIMGARLWRREAILDSSCRKRKVATRSRAAQAAAGTVAWAIQRRARLRLAAPSGAGASLIAIDADEGDPRLLRQPDHLGPVHQEDAATLDGQYGRLSPGRGFERRRAHGGDVEAVVVIGGDGL